MDEGEGYFTGYLSWTAHEQYLGLLATDERTLYTLCAALLGNNKHGSTSLLPAVQGALCPAR